MKRRGSAARVDLFDKDTCSFDFDINGDVVTIKNLPSAIVKQFEHWIETSSNNFEKVCFITQTLAKLDTASFLCAGKKYDLALEATKEAQTMLLEIWAKQLRANLNSRRIVGGGMGFLLSDETLPSGFDHKMPGVGIKLTAYQKLCEYNPKWGCKTVWLHTYPALSPYSVREYALYVYGEEPSSPIEERLPADIVAKLKERMKEAMAQEPTDVIPLLDGIYLHPDALVASGRDCDADIGFFTVGKKGNPTYRDYQSLPLADKGTAHLRLHNGAPKLPYEKEFDETVTVEEYCRRQLEKKGKNRLINKPDPAQFYIAERGASGLISGYTVGLRYHTQQTAKLNGWMTAVKDENQEHFAKHTEAIFDQRKVDAGVAADARKFTLQMGMAIAAACENAELFPILACRKKMHANFAQAIARYSTWSEALEDMFGQVRTETIEQDEVEFVDIEGVE